MSTLSTAGSSASQAGAAVSLKLLPFGPADPKVLFAQVEATSEVSQCRKPNSIMLSVTARNSPQRFATCS